MSSLSSTVMASSEHTISRSAKQQRTVEAFDPTSSLHPIVVGHMCKQDKSGHSFSKRYFALYEGGLLVYYTHQRDFEDDVKKHKGLPLHCTLLKLDGLYLTRPKALFRGIKHSFTLHTPESSNHRQEFILVCRTKKDMRIWVEQLQSQNTSLTQSARPHKTKTPCYIQRMRLQYTSSYSVLSSVDNLDSAWLSTGSYNPGDVALMFCADSPSILSTDSEEN